MLYRLMSPGGGAYRVQLTQLDGDEAAEVVFAGEGDETRVDLPPGDYRARVVELGQPAGSGRGFKVRLSPDDQQVRIADWTSQPSLPVATSLFRPSIRSVRLPRPSQLAPRSRNQEDVPPPDDPLALPGPRPDSNPYLLEPTYALVPSIQSANRLPATFVSQRQEIAYLFPGTYPSLGLRDFTVAISEDRSPERSGSWTRPQLVRATPDPMDDGLRFRFEQGPARVPRKGYRARLTIGLEGVPAIRVPLPIFAGGSTVEIRPIAMGGQVDFSVEIRAADDRVQALVAALAELPGEDALKILTWNANARLDDAIMILAEKRRDLWAATAAALLLVRTRRIEEVAQWPINLARLAPHIPDAGVAAAWARATKGSGGRVQTERQVMRHLQRGLGVGAPTFSVANSLALEMLSTLRNTASDPEIRHAAQDLYVRTARRSRYKLYRGPYMLWEQSGANLQSGRLVGPRYLELARGRI